MIELKNVVKARQNSQDIFYFNMSAEDLLALVRVEHFGVNSEGVNRKFDFRHAQNISEFMANPNSLLIEPIAVYLNDKWQYDNTKKTLYGKKGAQFILDEGQHRIGAFQFLSPRERRLWNMLVVGMMDLNLNQRLDVFAQQRFRKKLDPRLTLQILHKTGSLDPQTEAAYKMMLKINDSNDSPLKNKVLITEKTPRAAVPPNLQNQLLSIIPDLPLTTFLKEEGAKLNGVSLLKRLKRLLSSSHSVIKEMNTDLQYRIVTRIFSSAITTWPKSWKDAKGYYLFSARGIGGLLELLVIGENFKNLMNHKWHIENFKQVMGKMSYDWSKAPFKKDPSRNLPTALEIAHGLDFSLFEKNKPKKEK